jgi:hypothetical protein
MPHIGVLALPGDEADALEDVDDVVDAPSLHTYEDPQSSIQKSLVPGAIAKLHESVFTHRAH